MKSVDIKTEKSNAVLKYRTIQNVMRLFRYVEIFVFLVVISKFSSQFSSQLPSVVDVSGDYFRGISFSILSPKFVFLIGNVIVLILFLESRADENRDGSDGLCYEYVKSCDVSIRSDPTVTHCSTTLPDVTVSNKRKICRSKSENPIRTGGGGDRNQSRRELRRSVTELSRSKNYGGGGGGEAVEVELNGDEFRRTVEAFIARQQKMLRDEEFSPMVYTGCS